jgi:predicted histone-like DNA-binding protein
MSKYKVIQLVNPRDPQAAKRYYARLVNTGEITLRELSEMIADISTVSRVDVMAVLEAFVMLMSRQLRNGRTVRLGSLGSFALSGSSMGHLKKEEVNSNSIKSVKVIFRPGKEILESLKGIKFTKM